MGLREAAAGFVRERLGYEVIPHSEQTALREAYDGLRAFAQDAEELGWFALDYFSGRPQEMRPDRRKRLAQKSRFALTHDPLARAEASHLANFAFGSGIPVPEAKDEAVQKIIDELWSDPVNVDIATGFEAQRKLSNDLITTANLFPAAYITDSGVRLGMIPSDRVENVVTDGDNQDRPLWYLVRPGKTLWNYTNDQPKSSTDAQDTSPRPVYWPHWRNVEDARKEGVSFEGLDSSRIGPGFVYHIRINRVGETQFGTPPWAASLRFYSAMNEFLESRVTMAQAASQFIAKRVRNDSPEGLIKAARSVTNMAGELARARTPNPHLAPEAAPPGSWWMENAEDRLESMKLDSGAGAAAQDAQIIRSPLSAASGFGQHYLGDASNANLATSTSLELPTLMMVGAWQETFEQFYRWFTDLGIQTAVRAGRLGGAVDPNADSGVSLSELYLSEADGQQEMSRRTGRDLSYSFQMPYPGRRNLPDVTTALTAVLTAAPDLAQNEEFLKVGLSFVFTHGWQLEDPAGTAQQIVDRLAEQWKENDAKALEIAKVQGQAGIAPKGTGRSGDNPPPGDKPPNGARSRSTPPKDGMAESELYLDPSLQRVADDLTTDLDERFTALLLNQPANGNGVTTAA